MLKIRRPLGRLIFNMGIAIPGKTVFLIETAPSTQLAAWHSTISILECCSSCGDPRLCRHTQIWVCIHLVGSGLDLWLWDFCAEILTHYWNSGLWHPCACSTANLWKDVLCDTWQSPRTPGLGHTLYTRIGVVSWVVWCGGYAFSCMELHLPIIAPLL